MIDQFISSGERKWLRMSGLTLLLPHGHEGQGPEHTSGRLERFLQMCAEDNMQIINCTSPANYFHVLRRQLHRNFRKPLVIFTPKSTLRHKKNTSNIDQFINGSTFHRILTDLIPASEKKKKKRLILCSGKIYFEIQDRLEKLNIKNIAIIRLEQIYPFPYEIFKEELINYKEAEIIWTQEEPKNMGAWGFVSSRIESVMSEAGVKQVELYYVGRSPAASPAAGSLPRHLTNQENIISLTTEGDIEKVKKSWAGVSTKLKSNLIIE